jgi:myo-inositol 2-dehydrogenase / D-chiro-inositol 1-dehydrogenase
MAPTRLNIAVAGLGRMGKRHVKTLLNRVSRVNVVAVCSEQEQEITWARNNPEYLEFGIKAYSSFDEMLEHPNLQAVWISTSTDVHARQTLAGINKGLHVLCEKPLSTDLAEVSLSLVAPPRTN